MSRVWIPVPYLSTTHEVIHLYANSPFLNYVIPQTLCHIKLGLRDIKHVQHFNALEGVEGVTCEVEQLGERREVSDPNSSIHTPHHPPY